MGPTPKCVMGYLAFRFCMTEMHMGFPQALYQRDRTVCPFNHGPQLPDHFPFTGYPSIRRNHPGSLQDALPNRHWFQDVMYSA
jgi:hypothetical protein